MNATVVFGAVAVLEQRFRFMRLDFSAVPAVRFAVPGGS